jgi:hypothetical protein
MRDRFVLFTSLIAFSGLAYVACSSPSPATRRDAAITPDAFVPAEDAFVPGEDAPFPSEDAAMVADDAPTSGAT